MYRSGVFLATLFLTLPACADTVTLTFRDEAGAPVSGVELPGIVDKRVSGPDGTVVIPEIPASEVSVFVSIAHPDYVPQCVPMVFEYGVTDHTFDVVLARGESVSGVATDPDGTTLSEVWISAPMPPPVNYKCFAENRVRTGEDGRFTIHGVSRGEDGEIRLRAYKKGHSAGEFAFRSADPNHAVCVLAPKRARVVSGVVRFSSGRQPARGRIYYRPAGEDTPSYIYNESEVDAQGAFSLKLNQQVALEGRFDFELTRPPRLDVVIPDIGLPEERLTDASVWTSGRMHLDPDELNEVVFFDEAAVTLTATAPTNLPDGKTYNLRLYREGNRGQMISLYDQELKGDASEITLDHLGQGTYFAHVSMFAAQALTWVHRVDLGPENKTASFQFRLPDLPVMGPMPVPAKNYRASVRGTLHFDDGNPIIGAHTQPSGMRNYKTDGNYESILRGDPPVIPIDLYHARGWPQANHLIRSLYDPISSEAIILDKHTARCVAYVPYTSGTGTQDIVLRRGPTRDITVHGVTQSPKSESGRYHVDSAWRLVIEQEDYRLHYEGIGFAPEKVSAFGNWIDKDTAILNGVPTGAAAFVYYDQGWAGTVALPDPGATDINLNAIPVGSITGTVLNEDGSPYNGTVYLNAVSDSDDGYDYFRFGLSEPRAELERVEIGVQDGVLRLPRITPGTYALHAGANFVTARAEVTVTAGEESKTDLSLQLQTHPEGLPLLED